MVHMVQQAGPLEEVLVNIERVMVGKRQAAELALTALLAGGHLLLEDVPGVGKTTLCKALAHSIRCSFARIQFTPDTLPGDVTGTPVYNMHTGEFSFTPGVIMHEILLADEINRTSPKTQASLLEAMEERQITVDGVTYPLPELFMVIATQNPVEQLGTYRLPEAQLDRFMMRISLGYPESREEEAGVIRRFLENRPAGSLEPVISREEMLTHKKNCAQVKVHDDILSYAAQLTRNTRKSKYVALGASPRAAIALTAAARSRAYLAGRTYALPEDVAALAGPVLLHRLLLSPEAKLEGKSEKEVLAEAMRGARVPVL